MTDSISKNFKSLPKVAGLSPPGLKFLQMLCAFSHLRTSAHAHDVLSNSQSPCFLANSHVLFWVWLNITSSRKSSLTPPS